MDKSVDKSSVVMERLFMVFHGYWGNQSLDRFAIGKVDGEGNDIGLLNAKRVWARELAEFDPKVLYEAAKKARNEGLKFAPSLPEFRRYCDASRPIQIVPVERRLESPSVDPELVLRSKQAISDYIAGLQTVEQVRECPVIGLVAAAIGLAGGNEAEALLRLEREVMRKEGA